MTVNHATVYEDSWSAVNNALKTLLSLSIVRVRFPDNPAKLKDSDFPLLVQAKTSVKTKDQFFGRSKFGKTLDIMVDVWDRNPANVDTTCSKISNHFENSRIADLHCTAANGSDAGSIQINNKNYHFRIMALQFRFL